MKRQTVVDVVTILICGIATVSLLVTTNPQNLPFAVLLLPMFLGVILLFFIQKVFLINKAQDTPTRRRIYVRSAIIAISPMLLLTLQAMKQLKFLDVLLTLGFLVLVSFYVSKIDFL